jgi:hypothetical protein
VSNVFVGDNGTVLGITVSDDSGPVNLASTSSIVAHFVRADKTTFDKTLTVTDAANGECSATLTREDVSVAGMYVLQVTAHFTNESEFSGDIQKFTVSAKL